MRWEDERRAAADERAANRRAMGLAARVENAVAALRSDEPNGQWVGSDLAAGVLMGWRTADPALLTGLARNLVRTRGEGGTESGALLALAGSEPAPDFTPAIPLLVTALERERTFPAALRTLGGIGHPAAADAVRDWLTTGWRAERFAHLSADAILAPLAELPDPLHWAMRVTMTRTFTHDSLPAALASWERSPEPSSIGRGMRLVGELRTTRAREAVAALGALGPHGPRAAAPALERIARGLDRPPNHYTGDAPAREYRWLGVQQAAWAHWRLTSDPTLAREILGAALRSGRAVDYGRFAELGTLAGDFAPALRPRLTSDNRWERINAAYAWFHLTGDPAPALPEALRALEPFSSGYTDRESRTALRLVTAIGAPAHAAVPLLSPALASDERLLGYDVAPATHGRPREDTRLCAAIRTALASIAARAEPPAPPSP
ncbi:hypothetical protein ABZ319_38460 [Nocardia sp. NPDC005978]|uniref:hypothetical protein n=1 Tax=Nocardia sp. NPDC005978 TaxID=3156725 RepID=UPI0033B0DD8D